MHHSASAAWADVEQWLCERGHHYSVEHVLPLGLRFEFPLARRGIVIGVQARSLDASTPWPATLHLSIPEKERSAVLAVR